MVVDYEAAWVELQRFVAGKTQHGREGLLVEMVNISARHSVAPGEKSRVLRLYGIEVERERQAGMRESETDSPESLAAGVPSDADAERPSHHDERGHDGRDSTAGTGLRAV